MPPKPEAQPQQASPGQPPKIELKTTSAVAPTVKLGPVDSSKLSSDTSSVKQVYKGLTEKFDATADRVNSTAKSDVQETIKQNGGLTKETYNLAVANNFLTAQQQQEFKTGELSFTKEAGQCGPSCGRACVGCKGGVNTPTKTSDMIINGNQELVAQKSELVIIQPRMERQLDRKNDVVLDRQTKEKTEVSKESDKVRLDLIPALPPVKEVSTEAQSRLLVVSKLEQKYREELKSIEAELARKKFEREERLAQEKASQQKEKEAVLTREQAKEKEKELAIKTELERRQVVKEAEISRQIEKRKAEVLATLGKIDVMKGTLKAEVAATAQGKALPAVKENRQSPPQSITKPVSQANIPSRQVTASPVTKIPAPEKVTVTGANVNRIFAPANVSKAPEVSKNSTVTAPRLGRRVAVSATRNVQSKTARNPERRVAKNTATRTTKNSLNKNTGRTRSPQSRLDKNTSRIRAARNTGRNTVRAVKRRIAIPKRFAAAVNNKAKTAVSRMKKPLLNRVSAKVRSLKNSALLRPNRAVKLNTTKNRVAANLRKIARLRKPSPAIKKVLNSRARVTRTRVAKKVIPLSKVQIRTRKNLKAIARKTLGANRGKLNKLRKVNVKAKTKTKLVAKVNTKTRVNTKLRKPVRQAKKVSLKTSQRIQLKKRAVKPELRRNVRSKVKTRISTKAITKTAVKKSIKPELKKALKISAKTGKPVEIKKLGTKKNMSKVVDKYLMAKKDISITKKLLKLTKNPQQKKFLKMKLGKLEEREKDLLSFITKSKKKTKLRVNNSKRLKLHADQGLEVIVEESFDKTIRMPKKIKLYSENDRLEFEDPHQDVPENLIQ